MPESDVKYFPVLARILLHLGGAPLVMYRVAIVTQRGDFKAEYDLVHRFLTNYKGKSRECGEDHSVADAYRDEMVAHLTKKCAKELHFKGKVYEPQIEIVIDLRAAKVTLAT